MHLPLIVHERLGHWARQLRPRLASWPVRLIETRTGPDLASSLAGQACPIVVLDLADRPRSGLGDLDRALPAAPNALVLVLDGGAHPEVPPLARELGAAHVMSGGITPPAVVALLERWIPLARRRGESDGWAGEPQHEPEPWEID